MSTSLGATLYCLLTGKPPFEGDDVGVLLRAVQQGDFPPPRRLDPRIDRALEMVCLKAMARKAPGSLSECEGAGRRRGAMAGRRAGHRLARALDRAGPALARPQPLAGGGRGHRRAGGDRQPLDDRRPRAADQRAARRATTGSWRRPTRPPIAPALGPRNARTWP